MAQVDFSNAILEPQSRPMYTNRNLQLSYTAGIWSAYNGGGEIATNNNLTTLIKTSSKVTLIYTGVFTASGTEFYIGYGGPSEKFWKVSNISFASGDTYSFAIDIETSIIT